MFNTLCLKEYPVKTKVEKFKYILFSFYGESKKIIIVFFFLM